MSQAPAGWYPDPSGIPNAFRWWNGAFWTTALSASAGAPAPVNPAPAQGAGGPIGGQQSSAGSAGTDYTPGQSAVQSGSVGQPHPGPDYEPAAWRLTPGSSPEYGPGGPLPPAHGSGGMSTRAVVAVFAGVFVAAVLAGGLYLALNNRGEPGPPRPTTAQQPPGPASPTTLATPGQTPTPGQTAPATPGQTPEATPGQTPPATPGQTPSPTPGQTPGGPPPQPQPPQQPFSEAHFEFDEPGSPWEEEQLTGLLGATVWQWQGFSMTTEKDYDPPGTEDWRAIMISGTPSADFGIQDNPQKGLRAFSDWYRGSFFAGAEVKVTQKSSKKVTIDGEAAWQLVLDYSYKVPGLRATSERVTMVGMRTPTDGPALFMASIPNTHSSQGKAVAAAIKSLRVVQ